MRTGLNQILLFTRSIRVLVVTLFVLLCVLVVVTVLSFEDHQALADDGNKVELRGWGWSETVGWISLNCKDEGVCDDSDYQVKVDSDGNLSGFAWANPRDEEAGTDNIGWLSFNIESGDCPHEQVTGMGPNDCSPRLEGEQLKGWARFLSGDPDTEKGKHDGWDGWLHLGGGDEVNYGARVNTEFDEGNLAWGDEVVGWVGFQASLGFEPKAAIEARHSEYEEIGWTGTTLRIRGEDDDVDIRWKSYNDLDLPQKVWGNVATDEEYDSNWDGEELDYTGDDQWSNEIYGEEDGIKEEDGISVNTELEIVDEEGNRLDSVTVLITALNDPTCVKEDGYWRATHGGGSLTTEGVNYIWSYEYQDGAIGGELSDDQREGGSDELYYSEQENGDEHFNFVAYIDNNYGEEYVKKLTDFDINVQVEDQVDGELSDWDECERLDRDDIYEYLIREF